MSQSQTTGSLPVFYPEDLDQELSQQPAEDSFEDTDIPEDSENQKNISFDTTVDKDSTNSEVEAAEFLRNNLAAEGSTNQTGTDLQTFEAELNEHLPDNIGEYEKAVRFSRFVAIVMGTMAVIGAWGLYEGILSAIPTVTTILISILAAVFALSLSYQIEQMAKSVRETLAAFEREYSEELEKSKKSTFTVLAVLIPTGVGYGSVVKSTTIATTSYTIGICLILFIFLLYLYEFGLLNIIRDLI